jgi:hypothetical protein
MTNLFLMQKIKYQIYRVASCFNRVIELKEKLLIVLQFATRNDFFFNFDNTTEFLINGSLEFGCHFKQRK